MTYNVCYTEVFTGFKEVEANSEAEAMEIVRGMIEQDELLPTETYDGHEITVDFADEV